MKQALTIHRMFENYADHSPTHVAVIDGTRCYSYDELNRKANQLARFLVQASLQSESVIAVSIERSPDLLITLLAILKSGHAYLPLDASQPKERLLYILEDSLTPVLLTQSKFLDQYSQYQGRVIVLDDILMTLEDLPDANPDINCSETNLAYVIYTSGTTGNPKGVLIEHKSVVNYIEWFAVYSHCKPQSRIDFSSNIIFDMAVTSTLAALALGLQIVICTDAIKKNVGDYLEYLRQLKINLIKITPSYFKELIIEAGNKKTLLPDMQTLIVGGELLHKNECSLWLQMYPQHSIHNEYGPTETTVAVTQFKVSSANVNQLRRIVPIGKPGFNIELVLADNNELYVGGLCLARGYINQPELSAMKFIGANKSRLYKTGDICRYLPNNNLEFRGRNDDQLKIRGFRIEPGEIEARLVEHELVKDAVVIAREYAADEKKLIAYIIPEEVGQLIDHELLRHDLQHKIASYMMPSCFVTLPSWPLTANGKLDKHALPDPDSLIDLAAPEMQLERQLIEIWKKAFRQEKIGVNSGFFELGGHSLIAARIISEIEKTLGKKLELDELYHSSTIRELVPVIKVAKSSSPQYSNQQTLKNHKAIPLADFQFMLWVSDLFEPKVKKMNIVARRRISGKLDKAALEFAVKWVVQRHEILSFRVADYAPLQYRRHASDIKIVDIDLSLCSEAEAEVRLVNSLDELVNHQESGRHQSAIVFKIFHLRNSQSELQVCIPHIIFDDASENILFNELSTAYLNYNNGLRLQYHTEVLQYQNFVAHERNILNSDIKRDIQFWSNYLQDTSMLTLPESVILDDMTNTAYSSYLEIPDCLIVGMQDLCKEYRISITDIFLAAVCLTLNKQAGSLNKKVFVYHVRSVRDNETHDKMIGCFLRLDTVKMDLTRSHNLIKTAKQIQSGRVATEVYQACSGMVKLACLNQARKFKRIVDLFVGLLARFYCVIQPKAQLDHTVLTMHTRISSLRKRNQFMVVVNLLNSFMASNTNQSLFGYNLEKTQTHQCDLISVNNVLDISVSRNISTGKAHLVISGNIDPDFRMQLGQSIIESVNYVKVTAFEWSVENEE